MDRQIRRSTGPNWSEIDSARSQNFLIPRPVDDLQYLLVQSEIIKLLRNNFFLQFCHHFDQARKSTIFRNRRLEFGSIFENFLIRCSSVSDRYPGIDLWKSTFSVRWTLSRNVFEWIIHRWFNKNRS